MDYTDLMCITDAVRMFGVSSKTLRYYESVGLLNPIRNDDNKYRYYDISSIERIRQILILRKMKIPVKDIVRIYENEDMRTVVEVFVTRIDEIEEEIGALSELKRVVNDFLQNMIQSGITKISALPLLYEEMDKQLESLEEQKKTTTYRDLSTIHDKLMREPDYRIVELPAMRMLTSIRKDTGLSDADYFNDWHHLQNATKILSGSHEAFEYQNNENEVVLLRKTDIAGENTSPFFDTSFEGGLFAACSLYVDEDIGAYLRRIITSFEENAYYQIDYKHNGELRHEVLIESILSDDEQREKLDIFVPIRKRLPNSALFDNGVQIEEITPAEIEAANPILWSKDYPIEKEFVFHLTFGRLPTEIYVHYPYRVDLEFYIDGDVIPQYSGGGRSIPHISIRYGKESCEIRSGGNEDLSVFCKDIFFHQPIVQNICYTAAKNSFQAHANHHVTWIVGPKHYAIIVNGLVQYCSVNNPYMKMDVLHQPPHEIIIEIGQGIYKAHIEKITISQLRIPYKFNIKKGETKMITKQDNNTLTDIRGILHGEKGENYPFDDCVAFLLERLDCPKITNWYWIVTGITGSAFIQVYNKNDGPWIDNASQYLMDADYAKLVFDAIGYEQTYVTSEQLNANKTMYTQALMSYIDRGIPVISVSKNGYEIDLYVGYENMGKTLLYINNSEATLHRYEVNQQIEQDWIFVGDKKQDLTVDDICRNAVMNIKHWFSLPPKNGVYFGSAAFREWADDIERGRYENDTNLGDHYSCFICNLATNASNGGGAPLVVERFARQNPQYKEFRDRMEELYVRYSNQNDSFTWKALENLGGGFNVTQDVMRDKEKRAKIAAVLRDAAEISDEILRTVEKYCN